MQLTASGVVSGVCDDDTLVEEVGDEKCKCGIGFEMNEFGTCEDINECESEKGDKICSPNYSPEAGICQNTDGSYVCRCNRGYESALVGSQNFCVDVDECIIGSATCDVVTERCENTPGAYECHCRPDFKQCNFDDKENSFYCVGGDFCNDEFAQKSLQIESTIPGVWNSDLADSSTQMYKEKRESIEQHISTLIAEAAVDHSGSAWIGKVKFGSNGRKKREESDNRVRRSSDINVSVDVKFEILGNSTAEFDSGRPTLVTQLEEELSNISVWTQWQAWGICSTECGFRGIGSRTRKRNCLGGDTPKCEGDDSESEACNNHLCGMIIMMIRMINLY